jgi:hypothetical protein
MTIRVLALFLAIPLAAGASWVKQFNISDQQYRVYVSNEDAKTVTAGFYLTSFPCYSQNSSEYYITQEGKNILTLYCLVPPEEIKLSYIEKPRGQFIPKNEVMQGFYSCSVMIAGEAKGSVIPRLEVELSNCKKHELDAKANKGILRAWDAGGSSVADFTRRGKPEEDAPPAAAADADSRYGEQSGLGSIPYIDGSEP